MGGREPVCRAHRKLGSGAGSTHFLKGCAGATWRRVVVRDDLTTEPPAHCRLVSDHDLFKIVASLDCTPRPRHARRKGGEKRGSPAGRLIDYSPWRDMNDIPPGCRHGCGVCAPGRAGQGRPQAARAAGCLARAR